MFLKNTVPAGFQTGLELKVAEKQKLQQRQHPYLEILSPDTCHIH